MILEYLLYYISPNNMLSSVKNDKTELIRTLTPLISNFLRNENLINYVLSQLNEHSYNLINLYVNKTLIFGITEDKSYRLTNELSEISQYSTLFVIKMQYCETNCKTLK